MTLQCVSADLASGTVLADLPAVELGDGATLTQTLSNYDTVVARLNLPGAPENWDRATMPGGAVLAFYDDSTLPDGTLPQAIEWAGWVPKRHRDGGVDAVDLSLSTLEKYLDRRYVGDQTITAGTPWATAAAAMVNFWAVTGGGSGLRGIDLLTAVATAPGETLAEDLVWQNTDNVSVFGRLTELTTQYGGDFTVTWAWGANQATLVPTLYVGPRIGQATMSGMQPAVTFDLPGCITAVTMDEDYGDEFGGNVVTAYSNGQGTYTPYSSPQAASNLLGRPAFELRISPASSVTSTTRLNRFATQQVALTAPGAQPIALTYSRSNDTGRKYGVDWQLGDDIGYVIGGYADDGTDLVPAFPNGGITGTGRVTQVEISDSEITPVFAQPTTYGL